MPPTSGRRGTREGGGDFRTDVWVGYNHPPGSTVVSDPLLTTFSYGLRSEDSRVTSPTFVASLARDDDDFEGTETVRFLNQSYTIHARFEFHQAGSLTFMLGRQPYLEQYQEHCGRFIDWPHLNAEGRDRAFYVPTVQNCLLSADRGDVFYDQLLRVTTFAHHWNRGLLRRPKGPPPPYPSYLLLLDLQHRLSSRLGREIWVRRGGTTFEANVVNYNALSSGMFDIQYYVPGQQSHTLHFRDLADLKSQGVEFKNAAADNDVIDETAFVF